MKNKEEIFQLLRESVETPQESLAVEEMIQKIEGNMPPIETVNNSQKKCHGFTFYKNNHGRWVGSISLHRFIWTYFNGEIPDGYEIHHCDFDKENNDISNLILLTEVEHRKIHANIKRNRTLPKNAAFVCATCGKEFRAVNRGNNTYCSKKCRKKANHDKDKIKKSCFVCGKIFWSDKRKNAKFCSKKCMGKSYENQVIRTCSICGKEFSTCASDTKKYCSMECFVVSMQKSEKRACRFCGKEFIARTEGTQKYCSRECFFNSRRKREDKICPVCGKKFTPCSSNEQIYCSRECYAVSRRNDSKD